MEEIRLHPERPALNGWHLERIIDKWLSHCHGRVSEKTLSGYAEKILYFRRWWTDTGPSRSWVLTEDDFARFNRDLELTQSRFGKPLSLNTRNDAMRRLRQMLHWAYERGHMSFDYGKWVPTPDGSAPLRTAPPLDDLRRLIEATQVSEMPTRDRALLAVYLGTGARRSEAVSVDIEHVQIDSDGSGVLRVQAKRVRNRSTHERLVAFDAATGRCLRDLLDTLGQERGPLFQSRRGGRLSPIGAYKAIKRLIEAAGLGDRIQGPHDLRRYFSTYFSRRRRGQAHDHLLSKQLGHSTYRMTAQYTLQDIEDVREAIISPLAMLNEP